MRIGIDCRLAGTQHAGIGRYIQNLVKYLIKDKRHQWVLFFYDQAQASEVLGKSLSSSTIEVVLTPIKHYSLMEQLVLPFYFYQANLDLLHVPHFNAPLLYFRLLVVTIHDLLWHNHRGSKVTTLPQPIYWLKYFFYLVVVKSTIKRAKKIIVPAKVVLKSVVALVPAAANKTVVCYEGSDLGNSDSTGGNLVVGGIAKPRRNPNSLLFVGSLYPHKNIKVILEALRELRETTLSIVGSRSVFVEATQTLVEEWGLSKRVHFLGYLSDEKLSEQYLTCGALVQPSLSEGFGLTGVEAMRYGAPVIASDIPIFHEIYRKSALFFNPHDSKSFIKAYKKLSPKMVQKLRLSSSQVIKLYNWQTMSEQINKLYEEVI